MANEQRGLPQYLQAPHSVLYKELNQLQQLSKDEMIESLLHLQGVITSLNIELNSLKAENSLLQQVPKRPSKKEKPKQNKGNNDQHAALENKLRISAEQLASMRRKKEKKEMEFQVLVRRQVLLIKENEKLLLEVAKMIKK